MIHLSQPILLIRAELSNRIEASRDLPNTDKAHKLEKLSMALKLPLGAAMTSPLTYRLLCFTRASSVIVGECQNLEIGEKGLKCHLYQ